jgi:hypothetical protein
MFNKQFDLPSKVPCDFNVFNAVFPNVLGSKPTKRRRTNTKNYRQTKLIIYGKQLKTINKPTKRRTGNNDHTSINRKYKSSSSKLY